MDGIHDLGGKYGFGAIDTDAETQPFPTHWEGAVFTTIRALYAAGITHNTDQFRHAVERIDPRSYLLDGYYGRWLGAAETLLVEAGVFSQEEITARAQALGAPADDRIAARPRAAAEAFPQEDGDQTNAARQIGRAPLLSVGERVHTSRVPRQGHTRLPAYARGTVGVITAHHGGWVYPDTNAHAQGEQPQPLYTVRFSALDLFGDDADPTLTVSIDAWEPYLDAA